MAHNINIENGEASMFYCGKTPWHGLGTKLDGPATYAEAIEAAKLDWNVVKLPLIAVDPVSRSLVDVKKNFAVVPADKIGKAECPVFGIVGENYTPVQNSEAFSFFDSIVGEGRAIYHTAGALGKGERIWILAKLPEDIIVIGGDHVGKYLLLSNSHDGNNSVNIKFTPIRVVCQNTLIAALSEGKTINVPHLKDVKARLEKSKEVLGIIGDVYSDIEVGFKKMVAYELNQEKVQKYIESVFPGSVNKNETEREAENRVIMQQRKISCRLFETGRGNGMKGVRGTLWAAYNGITEMVDYTRRVYGDRRLNSVWFGEGARIKARAYNITLDTVDSKSK
ncbi:MAG: DUF932 domain-containing protein [Victivallales bacterium]|jgi:phage/plasmid-like protein (TIGR03299 family)